MVKITAPLMSQKASGSIGECLTFSARKSGAQVRYQKKQKDRQSAGQLIQRAWYSQAVAGWLLLDADEKKIYNERAKTLTMTGFNLYIKEFSAPVTGLSIYGERIFADFLFGNQ